MLSKDVSPNHQDAFQVRFARVETCLGAERDSCMFDCRFPDLRSESQRYSTLAGTMLYFYILDSYYCP